jgi:hypothetical protein
MPEMIHRLLSILLKIMGGIGLSEIAYFFPFLLRHA